MDVTLVGDPAKGSISGQRATVDPSRQSLRFSMAPWDHKDSSGNILGHYRTVLISGNLVSIGANGILFSAQWAGPLPPIALITRIQAIVEVLTAITVATPINFEAIGYKGYTALDTGGGVIIPTKLRTEMGNSSFADFRMATTAALGAGTRTLDSVGFGYAGIPILTNTNATGTAVLVTAGNAYPPVDIYKCEPGSHPFALAAKEGFAIRHSSAGPVTGTYRVTFIIDHSELPAF